MLQIQGQIELQSKILSQKKKIKKPIPLNMTVENSGILRLLSLGIGYRATYIPWCTPTRTQILYSYVETEFWLSA